MRDGRHERPALPAGSSRKRSSRSFDRDRTRCSIRRVDHPHVDVAFESSLSNGAIERMTALDGERAHPLRNAAAIDARAPRADPVVRTGVIARGEQLPAVGRQAARATLIAARRQVAPRAGLRPAATPRRIVSRPRLRTGRSRRRDRARLSSASLRSLVEDLAVAVVAQRERFRRAGRATLIPPRSSARRSCAVCVRDDRDRAIEACRPCDGAARGRSPGRARQQRAAAGRRPIAIRSLALALSGSRRRRSDRHRLPHASEARRALAAAVTTGGGARRGGRGTLRVAVVCWAPSAPVASVRGRVTPRIAPRIEDHRDEERGKDQRAAHLTGTRTSPGRRWCWR